MENKFKENSLQYSRVQIANFIKKKKNTEKMLRVGVLKCGAKFFDN